MPNCNNVNNTDAYVIAWRAWYENGEGIVEYTSLNDCLETLPEDGFQAMKLFYVDGNSRVMSGNDHYFFSNHLDGVIFGHSNDSYESILARYPNVVIKKGKHTTDALINEIHTLMMDSKNPIDGTN